MSSTTELAELHHLVGGLQRCVTSLNSRYGDTPAVRRIMNDVERLDIDAAELDQSWSSSHHPGEKIPIPDTQYDSEMWRDIDDEGVGGYNRTR